MTGGFLDVNRVRYCVPMSQPDWNARVAAAVAAQVRRHREAMGLSAQQLADECTALGLPIQRSVLANFEHGRRGTVSIAEVLVFATALNVSPIRLLFPIGDDVEVEALPGRRSTPWDAARWFSGEAPAPLPPKDELDRLGRGPIDEKTGLHEWYDVPDWREAAAPVLLFRQHDELMQRWRGALTRARQSGLDPDAARDYLISLRAGIEREIRANRDEMRRRQLTPPQLSEDLQHLDGEDV